MKTKFFHETDSFIERKQRESENLKHKRRLRKIDDVERREREKSPN